MRPRQTPHAHAEHVGFWLTISSAGRPADLDRSSQHRLRRSSFVHLHAVHGRVQPNWRHLLPCPAIGGHGLWRCQRQAIRAPHARPTSAFSSVVFSTPATPDSPIVLDLDIRLHHRGSRCVTICAGAPVRARQRAHRSQHPSYATTRHGSPPVRAPVAAADRAAALLHLPPASDTILPAGAPRTRRGAPRASSAAAHPSLDPTYRPRYRYLPATARATRDPLHQAISQGSDPRAARAPFTAPSSCRRPARRTSSSAGGRA